MEVNLEASWRPNLGENKELILLAWLPRCVGHNHTLLTWFFLSCSIAAEDYVLNSQCVATVDIEKIMFVDHVSYRFVS